MVRTRPFVGEQEPAAPAPVAAPDGPAVPRPSTMRPDSSQAETLAPVESRPAVPNRPAWSAAVRVRRAARPGRETAVGEARRRGYLLFGGGLLLALTVPLIAAYLGEGLDRWQLALVSVVDLVALAGIFWIVFLHPSGIGGVGREAMLAETVELSLRGRLIVSGNGRPIYANHAYRKLVGSAPEGPVPALGQLLPPGSAERQRLAHLARSAREGGIAGEDLAVNLGGRQRWLAITVLSLSDDDDRLVWYVDDVTKIHKTVGALRSAEDKVADFVDDAPIGYCAADSEGRITYLNKAFAAMLGLEVGAALARGLKLDEVLTFEEVPGGDPESGASMGEGTLRRPDGGALEVRVHVRARREPGGATTRTTLAVVDLSERNRLRQALDFAERGIKRFFEEAPVGMVMVDEEGRITRANRAFRQMIGAAERVGGSQWLDLVDADDRTEAAEMLRGAIAGAVVEQPIEVKLKGSRERIAQLFFNRLEAEGEDGPALLLHLIDTTEQKHLELQFAQSQKMQAVGQLAGGVAHDFNNLLTAMIGFCDLLLLRHPAGDPSFSDIMHIKQNANRAANLVRQLLAFSRQQTMRPQVVVLTDVLAELSNLLRRLIGENIELKIVHGRDLGPVTVDPGQIEQVIINLAVNARDSMTGGGTLTIRTANITTAESTQLGHELMPPGEYVLIEVSDTGVGIPKENLGKIFEPFFTTKEVGAGTGLGLSTVYGVIKQTGGFIFVTSQVGIGSSFKIYLPRHDATTVIGREAEEQEQKLARDLTGKGTILLVEDEDAVRMFAARALRNKGYTVLESDSGEGALATIREHEGAIELMISDVVMPNMDGPTLVGHARRERPDMRIIFISGYAEDAFRKSMGSAANEIEFLPKPFSLKQLASKVKDVMRA